MSLLSIIKTPISFAGWFLACVFFTLLCIPLTFLPAPIRYENRLYFFLTSLWTKFLIFFSFIHVKIRGEENLPKYPDNPSILVANHSSSLDIFLVENIAGTYPHIWLTKSEYTKIPFFSILLNRMHVPVQRENKTAAARAFLRVFHMAKNINSHIILFPEGRRHDDGQIHEFHPGFALLAKKLKRPVIPIVITGLHKIMPKGTILIDYHASKPTLTIKKPLYIQENESIEDFCKRVHENFCKKSRSS